MFEFCLILEEIYFMIGKFWSLSWRWWENSLINMLIDGFDLNYGNYIFDGLNVNYFIVYCGINVLFIVYYYGLI